MVKNCQKSFFLNASVKGDLLSYKAIKMGFSAKIILFETKLKWKQMKRTMTVNRAVQTSDQRFRAMSLISAGSPEKNG